MDLATLEAEVQHCSACGLAATRTHTVFGKGSPTAVSYTHLDVYKRQGLPLFSRYTIGIFLKMPEKSSPDLQRGSLVQILRNPV